MAEVDVIKAELDADPLTRGYAGMTAEQAAADLNTVYRTISILEMTGSEILQAIDATEFDALTDTQQRRIWDVLHLGERINPFGVEATLFTSTFGGGSTTITALAAIRKPAASRAAELGVKATVGAVQEARRL